MAEVENLAKYIYEFVGCKAPPHEIDGVIIKDSDTFPLTITIDKGRFNKNTEKEIKSDALALMKMVHNNSFQKKGGYTLKDFDENKIIWQK